MLKRFWIYLILSTTIILFACNSKEKKDLTDYPDYDQLQNLAKPELKINRESIRRKIRESIA